MVEFLRLKVPIIHQCISHAYIWTPTLNPRLTQLLVLGKSHVKQKLCWANYVESVSREKKIYVREGISVS